MNPNPFRTALLVLAIVGFALGVVLVASGANSKPELAPAGWAVLLAGAVMLTLWLVVSAIIHGIAVTPQLPARQPYADWLGTSPNED